MSISPDHRDALSAENVGERVVRGGLHRSVGFLITNLLSVVGAVLLLRYLGVEDFGRYGTVMALVNIVYGITDAGLTITGSRELAVRRDPDARRQLLAHVLTIRIVLTGLGVAAAVLFAFAGRLRVATRPRHGPRRFRHLPGQHPGRDAAAAQRRAAVTRAIAFNEVLRQAALVVAFTALVVLGAGLVPFFAAQIFVGVVLLRVAPLLLGTPPPRRSRWSTSQMRGLIEIALPVAVANVLAILYLRILVILMSLLSDDPIEVGYYVTSTRVVELVAGLPFLLGTVILPVLTVAARDDPLRMRYINERMTQTLALGGLAVAVAAFFAAEPIIVVLGGASYDGAVGVLQIQCLAVVTIFLAAAWNQTLVGMGHVRALVATTGAGLVAVVIAGVALIPPFEAEGAAVAAVVADLVLCVATYVALRWAGPGRELALAPLVRIGVAVVPAALVGLIPGLPDIAAALAATATFVVAAFLLKAIPSELVDGVRDLRGFRS